MIDEATRREWAANLKARRQALGFTQEELAALLEVRQPVISHWESGKRAPRDEFKLKLAQHLRIDARTLFPLIVREEVAS